MTTNDLEASMRRAENDRWVEERHEHGMRVVACEPDVSSNTNREDI